MRKIYWELRIGELRIDCVALIENGMHYHSIHSVIAFKEAFLIQIGSRNVVKYLKEQRAFFLRNIATNIGNTYAKILCLKSLEKQDYYSTKSLR